jgi:3-isopropylmalate/(R)-2-methylmalate dehydratase small subunit
MNPIVSAKVYVLGDNIDTDQIIPAKYLAIPVSDPENRARYGALALSGVPGPQAGLPFGNVPFVAPDAKRSMFSIVVAGRNFGCGSSREHAPLALAEAGVLAVVARSYARIFYRNAIDGGYFPPFECVDDLVASLTTGDEVSLDAEKGELIHHNGDQRFELRSLGAAGEIVAAGGIFKYARQKGLGSAS